MSMFDLQPHECMCLLSFFLYRHFFSTRLLPASGIFCNSIVDKFHFPWHGEFVISNSLQFDRNDEMSVAVYLIKRNEGLPSV